MKKELFQFQSLTEGIIQSVDTSLTKGSELLKNITMDTIGNYATRAGSSLLGAKIGTNQGYGLWSYNDTSGNHTIMAVTDRDLFAYNEGGSTWGSAVDTDEWTADKKVDAIDHLNRSYIGCEDGTTALAYSTGGAITDVAPTIGGNVLAVNKNMLAVGGGNILPNVIFYTNPYTDVFHLTMGSAKAATATCRADADEDGANYVAITSELFPAESSEGAIIYNTTDGAMATVLDWVHGDNTTSGNAALLTDSDTSGWNNDTVRLLRNNFKLDGVVRGSISYHDNFISCDEHHMYIWDPLVRPSGFSRKIPQSGFGCLNNRCLQIVNGLLFGIGKDGIWMKAGADMPQDITAKIRDRVNGYGIWDLINMANASEICMGSIDAHGQLWVSLGTLSTQSGAPASALSNVVIVLDVTTGNWTLRNYQDQITAFTNFVDTNGVSELYGIGKTDAAVWRFDTGTTDDDSAGDGQNISYEIRTPHHSLFPHPYKSRVEQYFIKYTATNSVTVTESVDRGSYSTLATLDAQSSVFMQGVKPKANRAGFSHSLKFAGTGAFELEGYYILAQEEMPFTGVPNK